MSSDANDEVQHSFNRNITCVKFPGIVKDTGISKAIQTFGGSLGLSQVRIYYMNLTNEYSLYVIYYSAVLF